MNYDDDTVDEAQAFACESVLPGGHLSSTQLVFSLTHIFPDSFLGDLFKLAKDFLFTGDWRRKTRHPASS